MILTDGKGKDRAEKEEKFYLGETSRWKLASRLGQEVKLERTKR